MDQKVSPAGTKQKRPPRGSKAAGDMKDDGGEINASEILSTRAMLASVRISSWSATRTDREITDKVNSDHDAEADAGRWVKQLIPREEMRDITAATSAARAAHYAYTMPWLDDGQRILASAHYPEYTKEMQRCREEFEDAVEMFVAKYPVLLKQAEKRMGKTFDSEDYPDVDTLAERFAIEVDLMNVPATKDWRVEIGGDAEAEIKARMEQRLKDVLQGTIRDSLERIADVVGNMVDGLTAFKPATKTKRAENNFRDSLVGNVVALLDLLPGLNLSGDKEMAALIERLKELVENDTDLLKGNEKIRKATADKAAAILKDVEAFLA